MTEILDSFKLSLNNPKSTKQEIGLFDVAEQANITPSEDGKGILFTTVGGAENGIQMPSIGGVNGAAHDTVNNVYYIPIQFGGIYVYDAKTKTGSLIDTGTVITGTKLPTENVSDIAIDLANNIIYAGTTSGVWKYDISNNTGKVYNNAGGAASGTQLPNDFATSVEYDSANHFLWVAGNGASFVWRLNLANEEGYNASANAVGEAYNGAANARTIFVDTKRNQLIVGTTSHGLWFYNIAGNTGLVFNAVGGATNGTQLPSNDIKWQMDITPDGVLYVPTYSGIWKYNINTDTGTVISDATAFNGDDLPNNSIISCYYVVETNSLHVGILNWVWVLDLDTDTGTTGIAHNTGDAIPVGSFVYISYYNRVYLYATLNNGVWIFIEKDQTIVGVNSGITASNAGSYESIVESIKAQPIAINKIIYQCDNDVQKANSIKIVGSDINGDRKSYFINLIKHTDAIHPYPIIPIELKQDIILDHKSYIQMNVEGNTDVNLIFEGKQYNPKSLLEQNEEILEPEVEVMEPEGSAVALTESLKFTINPLLMVGLGLMGVLVTRSFFKR